MKRVLLFLIQSYRLLLSPFLGTACRFVPTCSCYAHEAITKHGVIQGASLTLKRILRCHPFAHAGYDPVPSSSHNTIKK